MNNDFTFSLSLLFFWIRGRAVIGKKIVEFKTAHIIFGIIPAGSKVQTYPKSRITDVTLETVYNIKLMLFSICIIILGYVFAEDPDLSGAGFILFFLGIVWFLSGIETELCVRIGRGGNDFHLYVPFYEKSKMKKIHAALRSVIW